MLRGLKFHFDHEYVTNPVPYGPVLLWQVGDVGCDPGYIVQNHLQYCYEITCVVDGKGIIVSDEESYEITKGQCYLNRPGEIHRIHSDRRDPIRYFYLGFDFAPDADPLWTKMKETFDTVTLPLREDTVHIHSVFTELFDELITNDDASHEMVKIDICQILLLFYRELEYRYGEKYVSGGDMDASRRLVYTVLNYIDTNLLDIEHLEDIGKQLGYSYSYISRLFTRVMGKSMRSYYNEKRFEKAAALLKSGTKSTEIAGHLRYRSLHSFSKAFSNYFGISPTEYKEMYKRGEKLPVGGETEEG